MMRGEDKSILALDIAARMGFAFGKPGTYPVSGSVRLAPAGSSLEDLGAGLARWLIDFHKVNSVDVLYAEVPLAASHVGGRTTAQTILNLSALYGIALTIAKMSGIRKRQSRHVQRVRKHFIGTARPPDGKKAVIARCRQLGWEPVDDNAADALALWDFACAEIAPGAAIVTAPLFTPQPEAELEQEIPF